MTVCAAVKYLAKATSEEKKYLLLTISDRMQTVGDIEFEQPSHTKVYGLAPANAVCIGSGNTHTIRTLAINTLQQLQREHQENGSSSVGIGKVARAYAQQFASLRRYRAEQLHLAPLGLTTESFATHMPDMAAAGLVEKMAAEQIGVTAIIAGVDSDGPHIYTVGGWDAYWREMAYEVCHDAMGFTVIGAGAGPLESLFLSHNFDPAWGIMETLLLLYSGKKKAEAAAGVGPVTDIMVFSEQGHYILSALGIETLDRHYREFEDAARRKREETLAKMHAEYQTLRWLTQLPTSPPAEVAAETSPGP
jgi:hypothetical protein